MITTRELRRRTGLSQAELYRWALETGLIHRQGNHLAAGPACPLGLAVSPAFMVHIPGRTRKISRVLWDERLPEGQEPV